MPAYTGVFAFSKILMSLYNRYRHLAISDAKPAPTAAQIAAIETELQAPLPPEFLAFLQVGNAAYLDYYCDVPDGRGGVEQLCFCGYFSADDGDFCDETLVGELRAAREQLDMPAKILPFARDGGDSMLFLDLSDEGQGRVLAYIRELPAWTGPRAPSGLMVLAPSFGAYLDSLYIDKRTVLANLERYATQPSHMEATAEYLDIGLPGWRDDPEIGALFERKRRELCAGVQD